MKNKQCNALKTTNLPIHSLKRRVTPLSRKWAVPPLKLRDPEVEFHYHLSLQIGYTVCNIKLRQPWCFQFELQCILTSLCAVFRVRNELCWQDSDEIQENGISFIFNIPSTWNFLSTAILKRINFDSSLHIAWKLIIVVQMMFWPTFQLPIDVLLKPVENVEVRLRKSIANAGTYVEIWSLFHKW